MRTQINKGNPFGYNRMGFAWEKIPATCRAHLDFGCFDAKLLIALQGKSIQRLTGVDLDRDAISAGQASNAQLELVHLERTVPLPFADGTFDSITLLDVLEHVNDQSALLSELRRLLSDEGVLIVTVPQQYGLSFLDSGNYKFRFPRLHRWFYSLVHSRVEYRRRYRENPDGLIGDVEAGKGWHEHFSKAKLAELLERIGFEIVEFDGSAYFTRILGNIQILVGRLRPLRRLIMTVMRWDARCFGSMNLFCIARKKRPPKTSGA